MLYQKKFFEIIIWLQISNTHFYKLETGNPLILSQLKISKGTKNKNFIYVLIYSHPLSKVPPLELLSKQISKSLLMYLLALLSLIMHFFQEHLWIKLLLKREEINSIFLDSTKLKIFWIKITFFKRRVSIIL